MKIDVPFYQAKKDTDCGPLALKMIFSHFGEEHSFEEIAKLERTLDSGLVWSLGIARAAKHLGFPTKIVSTSNFNIEDDDIDFYTKYADNEAMLILKKLQKEIGELGLSVEEKDLTLNELLSQVTKDSIPVVLINWMVVRGKDGFHGHFVPVTGYDEDNVYVHNPGILEAQAYFPIKREMFLKAWESKGTDKDTIIICRKYL